MKIKNIRIAMVALAGFLSINAGLAQVTNTDYFMETSYLRNSLNPALRPDQGYLVLPILPNIGVNVQTNTFNLDNLTFKGLNGNRVTFMHPSISADQFLSNLSTDNYLNTDINMKLLGVGFYSGDNFWNIDLGIRTHIDANIPKSFFGLLKKGFDQNSQSLYDLSDLSATGYSLVELGIAHSRPFLNNSLIAGVRVKLLGGIADFDLHAKSLSIDAGPDYWRAKSEVTLGGSAPGVIAKYDEKGNLDGFDFGDFGMPGYGAGLDLGAVYDFKDATPGLNRLKVSAALNDIGFISWSKNNSLSMRSPATEVTITPSSLSSQDGASLSDVLEDAFDDIREAVNLREDKQSGRTTALRMHMMLGAEYEIFKHRLSVGALYSNRFGNYFNKSEFTVSANARLSRFISTSFSYSFMHSKFDTFGFALHLAPTRGINLFLASDYAVPHVNSEFIPTTSKAINFQMGISIPLGSKKSTKKVSTEVDDIDTSMKENAAEPAESIEEGESTETIVKENPSEEEAGNE